jgi:glycosyltransferase involved in cell wall biosynthesis
LIGAYEVQEGIGPFEIIAVDDGSTDDTPSILTSWRPDRFSLTVERQSHLGPAAARNRALAKARGSLVVFTGDDIVPHPKMLKCHHDTHERLANDKLAVLGLTTWPENVRVTATMKHIDGVGGEQFAYHTLREGMLLDFRFFYTSNVSIHRSQVESMNHRFDTGFPDAAYEDIEFAYRLFGEKRCIYYCSEPRAEHYHFHTARTFAERQFKSGESAAYLVEKWPQLTPRLGTRAFRRLRWRSFWALRTGRRVFRFWRSLDDVESSVVSMVANFDEQEGDGLTDVRRSLFSYFYIKGVATHLLERDRRSKLLAHAMEGRVLKSIRNWIRSQSSSLLDRTLMDETLRAYFGLPSLRTAE